MFHSGFVLGVRRLVEKQDIRVLDNSRGRGERACCPPENSLISLSLGAEEFHHFKHIVYFRVNVIYF